MNILFLMKAYDIGGIEVVAATLADSFVKHGHKVAIASFKVPDAMMVARTNPEIPIYTVGKFECSAINADRLRKILIADSIDVVINQWGLPYIPCKVLNKAKKGLNIKTIAVYHNQIDTNARVKNVEIAIVSTHNPLKRILLNIQKMIVRQITSASMRYVCHHSDIYQVLSCSYVELFKRFTGIKSPQKLMVQTNPVTVNSSGYHYSQTEKQKEFKINQSLKGDQKIMNREQRRKQDRENRFWNLCNGGKIQYVKYPIDYNIEAIKSLVRRAMQMGLYEGVNLSLSYCDDCGHQELDMDVCPKCGSKNLTKIERMNGYLSYSRVHGESRLNDAKMAEIAERKSM